VFSPQELFAQPQDPYIGIVRTTIVLRKPMILILFLVVPVAFGAIATLASRPYKAAVTSVSWGSPVCMGATEMTWYGFPVPWFVTGQSKFLGGDCLIQLVGPFSGVVGGAFLLDVLIYMAAYYSSVLVYVGIRRVVFTRMRLSSRAMKPIS